MMSVCLGEDVPPEYAPLMREEMGLISRDIKWRRPGFEPATQHKVAIIGAGVSGVALAVRLPPDGVQGAPG